MNIEKKLQQMMDYQHFENNPRLAKIISTAENRYKKAKLNDDDLNMVNAAEMPNLLAKSCVEQSASGPSIKV